MKIPFVFKKCTKCGRWLVANTVNFYKQKNGKYGFNGQCKKCKRDYDKEHNKNYYKENKEKIAEAHKKHYEENKEKIAERKKNYYEEHKEQAKERNKKYYEEHKEKLVEKKKIYRKTPQGQVAHFNSHCKRRKREEQQGEGFTGQQWLEMMKFFDFKCAYSGITLNTNTRSIDHIVPLTKGGAHEIWNLVPMDRSLNSSKRDKDIKEWYPQQDFYSEDRLNKINEWREYAYNKWSKEVNTKTI